MRISAQTMAMSPFIYTSRQNQKGIRLRCTQGAFGKMQKNIALYGAEEVIETRLGSGLTPLRPGEAETAIMAGMGGMLIVHILQDSPEVADSLKELVLSPQRDFGAVRKYLHQIGFAIREEHTLKEENKPYVLMRCERAEEHYDREIEYLYGKRLLEKKDPNFKRGASARRRKIQLFA